MVHISTILLRRHNVTVFASTTTGGKSAWSAFAFSRESTVSEIAVQL
jgi:hypothetical protein